MPQHISILSCSSVPDLFSYTFRSSAILRIVGNMLEDSILNKTLDDLLKNIFGSSGVGYCFEYFTIRNLGHGKEAQIAVSHLPLRERSSTHHFNISRKRLCYFSHENSLGTLDSDTLYIPLASNYVAVGAIGWGVDALGQKFLIFYQSTISDNHPIFRKDQNVEGSRAAAMVKNWTALVNNWTALAGASVRIIVVFISCNNHFEKVQGDYTKIGLDEQYLYHRPATDHIS
jgi:hypothetical protein